MQAIPFTTLNKDYFGKWVAKTKLPLAGDRQLTISTSKDARGSLVTYASMAIVKRENGAVIETFEMYGDYMKTVRKSQPKVCTQKAVGAQQEAALVEDLQLVLDDVKAFYAAKGINVEVAA